MYRAGSVPWDIEDGDSQGTAEPDTNTRSDSEGGRDSDDRRSFSPTPPKGPKKAAKAPMKDVTKPAPKNVASVQASKAATAAAPSK